MTGVPAALRAQEDSRETSSLFVLVEEFLRPLSEELVGRTIAFYGERSNDDPAFVHILPKVTVASLDGYSLELRFASWLTGVDSPQVRTVPTFLLPWLKAKRVLLLPLQVSGKFRGALVVDAVGLGRSDVIHLEAVAGEISDALAQRSSAEFSVPTNDSIGESMCRIKLKPPVL